MRGLSPAKAQALNGVVRSLPDAALGTLRAALSFEPPGGWSEPVRAAAEAETADRRLRDAVLRELVAVSRPGDALIKPLHPISTWAPGLVWRSLGEIAPDLVKQAANLQAEREYERFEAVSLELLETVADALEGGAGPFAILAERLDRGLGGADRVARIARLSALVRLSVPRARAWLKTGAKEEAAGLRLAVGDASALCTEGGPLFIDMLAAQFDDPWAGLRLVSAVMDKPQEAFLAASELEAFAAAVFAAIEEALEALRSCDNDSGREAGAAAARALQVATDAAAELEHWVQLDREQPWGRRVQALKRALTTAVEARLKEADGLVAAALPVMSLRPGVKIMRGAPDLGRQATPLAVRRAEASLVFLEETRRAADMGGFAGLRNKVLETLDARIDTYAGDLLDLMRNPDPDAAAEARARLPMVADFLGLVREPAAGQMLRRRLAAAA